MDLAHDVLDPFGLQLAFPYDDDVPSVLQKHLIILLVALLVAADFVFPKFAVGCWEFAARRMHQAGVAVPLQGVSVPKAPVHEDCRPVFPHHDIGFARHALHVEPVAVPVPPQPLSHFELGLGAAAVDVRHAPVSLGGSETVGHVLILVTMIEGL